MKTKKEFKLFLITDFEREEAYLSEMHRKGWKFVSIGGALTYHFEETAPADVVYKIDFKPNTEKDFENYYQLYRDYGWEYVTTFNNFYIFRKSGVEDGNLEIFNDEASKQAMIKQIFRRRFLLIVFLYLVALGLGFFVKSLEFALGIAVTAVPLTIYLAYRFYQLRKK